MPLVVGFLIFILFIPFSPFFLGPPIRCPRAVTVQRRDQNLLAIFTLQKTSLCVVCIHIYRSEFYGSGDRLNCDDLRTLKRNRRDVQNEKNIYRTIFKTETNTILTDITAAVVQTPFICVFFLKKKNTHKTLEVIDERSRTFNCNILF